MIRRRRVGIPKFLRCLRTILTTEDPRIIRWSHSGTAIQIFNVDLLAKLILPKYFKHGKYSSFQRQLNYFGFKKWTKTQTNICTFSNPHFLRSEPNELGQIKRKNHPVHPRGAECNSPAGTMGIAAPAAKPTTTKSIAALPPASASSALETLAWDDFLFYQLDLGLTSSTLPLSDDLLHLDVDFDFDDDVLLIGDSP